MMLLAFHIMVISLLIMVVGNIGFKMGIREGEKRLRRKLAAQGEAPTADIRDGAN